MLAQNFKTADELRLSEKQRDALIKTLALMDSGRLKHVPQNKLRNGHLGDPKFDGLFNMAFSYLNLDCGTVCCIRGIASLIGDVEFPTHKLTRQLRQLFYIWSPSKTSDPSIAQAAMALRSYLTTGKPRWDLVQAE